MTAQAICTIITKSHLCYARTLAESVRQYHPEMPVYVLLADRIDDYFDPSQEPFKWIYLEDLPNQDILRQMSFYYTPFELCCALRGWLHEYLFEHTDLHQWLFLDSDILVMHDLQEIFQKLELHSLLLNPHFQAWQKLLPDDQLEQVVLRAGLYNGGFLGMRRCEETWQFIQWFQSRLRVACFDDLFSADPRGLFVDQRWLNLVPLYFSHIGILTNPGVNLGHWNLFERTLELHDDGAITANSEPLLFVHFSGWNIENPAQVSKHHYTSASMEQSLEIWAKLGILYRDRLLHHDYEITSNFPYTFGQFSTGEPIQLAMRHAYYEDLMQGDSQSSDPFEMASQFYNRSYLPGTSVRNLQAELTKQQAELQHTQTELQHTQTELQHTQTELQHSLRTISAMESSLFWKAQKIWLRLKGSHK